MILDFSCRHRYGSGFALDASFATDAPVTALVGPSGSGKSTILSLIAGLQRPDAGSIRLGERTLYDGGKRICLPSELRQVGLVFQDHLLFPHLTVAQNLDYGLKRRPARRIDSRKLIEILEIGELLDRSPRTLSGGQRQRVALGRAMLRGPDLLLMDEPLTALDDRLKAQILDYLKRALAEFAIPTVLVSHNRGDVARLADKVIELAEGAVVTQDA